MAPDSALTNYYVAPTAYNDMSANPYSGYNAAGAAQLVNKMYAPAMDELSKQGGGRPARPWDRWDTTLADPVELPAAPVAKAADPTLWGEFTRGFERNVDETQGMFFGAAGMIGDLVGSDKLRDWGFEGYKANEEEAAKNAAAVGRIEDIHSGRDFALWMSGTMGSLAPTMIGALATSGVGAAIGSRALGAQLFGTAVQSASNKVMAEAIASGATHEAAAGLANAAGREAAKAAAKNWGAQTGLVGYTTALESGGNWTKDMQEHGPGKTNPGQDLFFGFLSGLTESIMGAEGSILRRATGVAVESTVEKSFRRALVEELTKNIGKEASQEGLQEILSSVNANIQDGKALLTMDDLSAILNAAAAGAVGGIGFGAFEAVGKAKSVTKAQEEAKAAADNPVSTAEQEMQLLVKGHQERVLQANSVATEKFGLKIREQEAARRELLTELSAAKESGDQKAEKAASAKIAANDVARAKLKQQYDQLTSLEQKKLEQIEKTAGRRIASAHEVQAAEDARVARLMAGSPETYSELMETKEDVNTFVARQRAFATQRLNGLDAAIANMNSRLEGVWSGWSDNAQIALVKEQLDKLHALRLEQQNMLEQLNKKAADVKNDIDKFGTTDATLDGSTEILNSKAQGLFGMADNRTHILPELYTTAQLEMKQRELDAKKAQADAKAEEAAGREKRSEEMRKEWDPEQANVDNALRDQQAQRLLNQVIDNARALADLRRSGRGTSQIQLASRKLVREFNSLRNKLEAKSPQHKAHVRAYVDRMYEDALSKAMEITPPSIIDAGSRSEIAPALFPTADTGFLGQAQPTTQPQPMRHQVPPQIAMREQLQRQVQQQEQLARLAKQQELANTFESDLQGKPFDNFLDQSKPVGDPNALAGPSLNTWGALQSDHMGAAPFQTIGDVASLPAGMDHPASELGPPKGQQPGRGVHPMDVGRPAPVRNPEAPVVQATPTAPVSGAVAQLQSWVKNVLGQLPVLQDKISFLTDEMMASLPAEIQKGIRDGAAGVFWNGKIILVPQNINSKQHAVRTVIHEGVVHYGLRTLFTDAQRTQFLKLVDKSFRGSKEWKSWIDNHPTYGKADALTQAEEFVARYAEKKSLKQILGGPLETAWAQVKSFIRSVLNKLGVVKITDDHLMSVLQASALHLNGGISDQTYKSKVDALLFQLDKLADDGTKTLNHTTDDTTTREEIKTNLLKDFRTQLRSEADKYEGTLFSMPDEANKATDLTHVGALEERRAALPTTKWGWAKYIVGEITGYRMYTAEDGSLKKHTLLERMVEMGADAHRRIQVVQRYLKESGGVIGSTSNLYKHLTGMNNRMAQDVGEFWDRFVSRDTEGSIGRLLQDLKIHGVADNDTEAKIAHVGDMLHALHGLERNRSIRERSGGTQKYSSGWTDKQCHEVLDRYTGNKHMDAIVRQVQIINNHRLQLLEDSRIFPADLIKAWRKEYRYYVPLKNWDEIVKEIDPGYAAEHGRSGLSVGTMSNPRATGRNTLAQNPLVQAINQTTDIIRLAHKVEAGQVLLELVNNNKGMTDLWEIGSSEKQRFALKTDKETGDLYWVKRGGDQFTASGVPVVTVIDKDGNHVRIGIHDKHLARALRGENIVHAGPILQQIGKITRMMAIVNTNLSPGFILTNPIRDIETALMNLGNVLDENKRKGLLSHANEIRSGVLKDIIGLGFGKGGRPVAKTLYKILSGKEMVTEDELRIYSSYMAFKRLGGHTRMIGLKSFDDVYTDLRSEVRKHGWGESQIRKALDGLDTLSNVAENATRLSVYMRVSEALEAELKKSGLTGEAEIRERKAIHEKASNIALELTVNFTRKGGASPIFNSLYMFASANIAGNKRMLQNIFRKGDTHAQNAVRLSKYLGGAAAAQLMLAAMCRGAMGNDDDGVNFYDKIPDYVKNRHIILPSPFGDGKYIKIPVAYGYNIFWTAANGIDQMINGRTTPGKATMNMANSMFDSFSPIGGSDEGWTMFVPTIFRPVAQIATNRNFTGSPIKPDSTHSYAGNVPESQKYWSTVSPLAKFIAQDILGVGGDKHRAGLIDVSPEVLEHLTTSYLGGMGRTLSDIYGTASAAVTGKDVKISGMPVVNRIAGGVGYQETLGMYNDVKKEILTQYNTVDQSAKEGVRGQDLLKLRQDNKIGYSLHGVLTTATNNLNEIRKGEKELELRHDQNKITSDAYYERQKKFEEQKARIMKQVIKAAESKGLSYDRS